jgi:diguanylate cyclase (GGDEF)-like protein
VLDRECRRNQRNGMPFSLAMIDVDFFKQYNDRYGHARGDWVLKSIAHTLSGSLCRPADFVARYGGEEFAMILPDTDARGARETAERARLAVETLASAHEGSTIAPYVTISIGGCTAFGDEHAPQELIELADAELYEAKRQGRNRVLWTPS